MVFQLGDLWKCSTIAVYKAEDVKGWVMCNDEEVVKAEEAPVGECYLVFYERCE